LPMILTDAPRCLPGWNMASISSRLSLEENALSFLTASAYWIPLSLASNATL
jgi:hypothetical protein